MFSTRVAKGTMARQLRKNFQTFLGISRTSMESFWMAISGVFTELTKRLPFDLSMRPSWSSRAGFLSFGCVRSSQGHRTHHALHEFTSCFKIQFVQLCNFVHQKSSTWHQKSSTNSSRRGQWWLPPCRQPSLKPQRPTRTRVNCWGTLETLLDWKIQFWQFWMWRRLWWFSDFLEDFLVWWRETICQHSFPLHGLDGNSMILSSDRSLISFMFFKVRNKYAKSMVSLIIIWMIWGAHRANLWAGGVAVQLMKTRAVIL